MNLTRRDGVVAALSAAVTSLLLLLIGTVQGNPDGSHGADTSAGGLMNDPGAPPTPGEPDGGSSPGDAVDMSPSETVSPDNSREPEDAPVLVNAPAAGAGPVPAGEPVTCPEATIEVNDAESLAQALDSVAPGDTIEMADGEYQGEFVADKSGTTDKPIFLCGSRDAVLDGGDVEGGYVMHLDGASYWRLVGFSVTNGQKGVMTDQATGVVVQDLAVSDIGDEAIHLRDGSTKNMVLGNDIGRTGLRRDKFGEGVYLGTAVSNWCSYTDCKPDRSDFNLVKDNTFSQTSSEAVDAKEGTTGGVITGNTFDGSDITGADSWVDVKGNNYLIADNRGENAPEDGFQTHQILPDWGDHNVFVGNSATVNGPGNGIASWPPESNVVMCDNTSSAAGEGLSNIECTS